MQNKDIVIIALILVAIYLYYQQNNQPNISKWIRDNSQVIQDLEQQVLEPIVNLKELAPTQPELERLTGLKTADITAALAS